MKYKLTLFFLWCILYKWGGTARFSLSFNELGTFLSVDCRYCGEFSNYLSFFMQERDILFVSTHEKAGIRRLLPRNCRFDFPSSRIFHGKAVVVLLFRGLTFNIPRQRNTCREIKKESMHFNCNNYNSYPFYGKRQRGKTYPQSNCVLRYFSFSLVMGKPHYGPFNCFHEIGGEYISDIFRNHATPSCQRLISHFLLLLLYHWHLALPVISSTKGVFCAQIRTLATISLFPLDMGHDNVRLLTENRRPSFGTIFDWKHTLFFPFSSARQIRTKRINSAPHIGIGNMR